MGKEKVRKIEIEYNPDEIDEQEKIWNDLEDKTKKGILKNWRITKDEEREHG